VLHKVITLYWVACILVHTLLKDRIVNRYRGHVVLFSILDEVSIIGVIIQGWYARVYYTLILVRF
jgi:hypothetical protein